MSDEPTSDGAGGGRLAWRRPLVCGLAYGLLMALALPPAGLWWLALAAAVPVALGAEGRRPAHAGLWFGAGVLPYWLYLNAWITEVTALGYVPMCVHLAAYAGVAVWAIGLGVGRLGLPLAIATPVAWTGVEFIRGEVLWNGYPWALACHPLIEGASLAAPATVGGQYLVLFLVAGVGGGAADIMRSWRAHEAGGVRRRRLLGAGAAVACVTGWVILGVITPAPRGRETIRVAVVQTNVPQNNKLGWTVEQEFSDWRRFEALTRDAAARSPDFIVWPETMMPGPSLEPAALRELSEKGVVYRLGPDPADPDRPGEMPATEFADRLLDVQARTGIPMVVGEEGLDGLRVEAREDGGIRFQFDRRCNSVYVIAGGRITRKADGVTVQRYDKMRLTPFGEEMPYIRHWPWLQRQMLGFGAGGMSFDLTAGTAPVVLSVACESLARDARIVTPICFEATYPSLCRRLVFDGAERRADVMVNLTNDGWFAWSDAGREQHLQIARWRCLELATPMVRAANTGVSALIDARGGVVVAGVPAGRSRVEGVVSGEVVLGVGATPYARFGDIVGWASVGGTGILLAACVCAGRLGRSREGQTRRDRS